MALGACQTPMGRCGRRPGTQTIPRKAAMLTHLFLHRLLWATAGLLAAAAAGTGLWRPAIYNGVVAADLIPGAYSQDLLSAAAGLGLLYLSLAAGRRGIIDQTVRVGLLRNLIHAFG